MAKNWTVAEAVKIIREGKDKEAMIDIGKRFPLLALALKDENGLVGIIESMPGYMTARKVNTLLVGDTKESEPADEDEADEDEEEEASEYDSKTLKDLIALARERKIKLVKGMNKGDIIKALVDNDNASDEDEEEEEEVKPAKKAKKAAKKPEPVEEEEEDEDWDEEEEEEEEPAPKKKKAAGKKKPAKKAAPVEEDDDEDDDEDDWDI